MPDLNARLHLDMLSQFRRQPRVSRLRRVARAVRASWASPVYGLEWGDPDVVEPLRHVRDTFVLPYVDAEHRAVEIGPGGGRWTRYLLGFGTVYAVDYHQELLEELRRRFRRHPHVHYVKNNGTDFPGIEAASVDYVFTFGTFVHLDLDLIEAYLRAIRTIVTPQANVVLQYADKTKIMGRLNDGFSETTPATMREAVRAAGFVIAEEDTTSLWHSSVMRLSP